MPPAPTVRRHLAGVRLRSAHRFQLPIHRCAPTPVLELHHTQPVPDPLVEFAEHLGCLRKLEVRLPAWHVGPQPFGNLGQVAPARATCELPDTLLEGLQRLVGHPALDLPARAVPEGIAQKLAARGRRDGRLGVADLQVESIIELGQARQHPFARPATAHIYVAVIGVAHEAVTPSLQFPIHLVEQHIGQERR
ncbi:hypothetical protein SDC9_144691 [bioreactor metagenome]|uniref:Uncharacterized protein n=1 Tax=bioreactor metagenome TaxID=1076179 RepID=A0A645E8G6_9ZZZZ